MDRANNRRPNRRKMGNNKPSKPTRIDQMNRPLDRLTAGQLERLKRMQDSLRKRPRFPATGQGMLKGGQAKLDRNKNNKIDAQDFKILRAEKAKGRGKGLQDEKMKPGKVMKADKGKMIRKDPTAPIKNVGVKDRYGMPMKVGKQLGRRAAEAAKATRIGKIAAGVAGAALAAKAGLEKLYEKRTGKKPFTKREKKRTLVDKKMGGGMMKKPMGYDKGGMPIGKAVGKAVKKVAKSKFVRRASIPFMGLTALGKAGEFLDKKIKAKKKMGGGMMKKVPGYKKGSLNQGTFSIGPFKPKPGGSKPSLDDYDQMKKKMGGGLMEATQRLKAQGKMGGGMMMRPNPVGMKSGKSVKVKCKLGRNKPTKMY